MRLDVDKTRLSQTRGIIQSSGGPFSALPTLDYQTVDSTPGIAATSSLAAASRLNFASSSSSLSFSEFHGLLKTNPYPLLRPVTNYVIDAISYWNKAAGVKPGETVEYLGRDYPRLAFIEKPWTSPSIRDPQRVQGQIVFFNTLFKKLRVLERMPHPNKILLIHGPNASGKTRTIKTLFEMLEAYSKTDEGALFTFDWVFDDDVPTMRGFAPANQLDSYYDSPISSSDIRVRIPGGKNANPVFLLSLEERLKIAESNRSNMPDRFNSDSLMGDGLSDLSRKMYMVLKLEYEDELRELYGNKLSKKEFDKKVEERILRHIHIRRWEYSSASRTGLVLVQPDTPEGDMVHEISPGIDWTAIPPRFLSRINTVGLNTTTGEFTSANRGLRVADDFGKKRSYGDKPNVDGTLLAQLRLAEYGETSFMSSRLSTSGSLGSEECLDVLQICTTNDDTYAALRELPEWTSLRGRFDPTHMGVERKYLEMAKVFKPQLEQIVPPRGGRHLSPRTLEAFALWFSMTYMIPSQNAEYFSSFDLNDEVASTLAKNAAKLSPLRKALLYQSQDPNAGELHPCRQAFTRAEIELLMDHRHIISDEFPCNVGTTSVLCYEGGNGIQTRDAEPILQNAALHKEDQCMSVVEIFEELRQETKRGFPFEKLREDRLAATSEELRGLKELIEATTSTERIPELPENLPPPTEILDSVVEYEKIQIKYDIYRCLDFIKEEGERVERFKKYCIHARCLVNKNLVPDEYQIPKYNDQPNIDFLSETENMILDIGKGERNPHTRSRFREEVAGAISVWANDHFPENPLDHILEIFPEKIKALEVSEIDSNENLVTEFVEDVENNRIQNPHNDHLQVERAVRFEEGIRKLTAMGYCPHCIPKLVAFAFDRLDV